MVVTKGRLGNAEQFLPIFLRFSRTVSVIRVEPQTAQALSDPDETMTHHDLRETLQSGQDVALTALYDRYAQQGINFAFGYLGNRSDSEDVVHDAFCRLMAPGQRHRLDQPDEEVAAVFLTSVRNLAIDLLRRRHRRRCEPLREHGRTTSQEAEISEGEVKQLMDDLPREWAQALRFRIERELSYAQIAESMKCSIPQVRTWIYRARKQLAEELQRRGVCVKRSAAADRE